MADEGNFDIDDIDIYGDGGDDYQEEDGQVQDASNTEHAADASMQDSGNVDGYNQDTSYDDQDHPAPDTSLPKPPIPMRGGKRKDGPDDRPVDPGATNALFVGELNWWTNDDEVRGWANEARCEDELKEVTFNEQKVNGKSKGQVYLLFETPQASTSAKHKIDQHSESGKYRTKFSVSYTNPLQNPFKTLPKDGPARNQNRASSGNFGANNNHQGGFNPSYRGRGRGNFNNNNANGGGGFNRGGFQGNAGGFNNNQMGGGGFQGGNMGGMQNFGGGGGYRGSFQGGRGGNMGGMRGGRGGIGMQPSMPMGMPMGGGMMPNMGMAMPMAGGMGMPAAFPGGYNPAFGYPQVNPGGDQVWSGGPNKRPRQE